MHCLAEKGKTKDRVPRYKAKAQKLALVPRCTCPSQTPRAMSLIYYRFKNAKGAVQQIRFDAASLSVGDVGHIKRQKRLATGTHRDAPS